MLKTLLLPKQKKKKKYWEFYAKSGSYNSGDNSVQLNDVIGNFYDKNGEVVVSFKSDKGNYDETSKKVILKPLALLNLYHHPQRMHKQNSCKKK